VLKEIEFSAVAQELMAQLNELRNVVFERLLTTPLEVLQRKEFIEDVENNVDKIRTATENMNADLAEAAADAEQKVFHDISSVEYLEF